MSRIPPIALPPAETLEELRLSVQTATNKLIEQFNQGGAFEDFNLREHRGVNCAWPSALHDVVNVEYLESVLPESKRTFTGHGQRNLQRFIRFVNFSLGGSLIAGERITPKPPARLRGKGETGSFRGRCIFAQANVDTPGSTRSVFDILIQPADETEPRYSILAPGLEDKLIVLANTREQTILELNDLGSDVVFTDGDFFTLDILEAGAGAADGHVLVGFLAETQVGINANVHGIR